MKRYAKNSKINNNPKFCDKLIKAGIEECRIRKTFKKTSEMLKVSFPKAMDVNQIVSLDLK